MALFRKHYFLNSNPPPKFWLTYVIAIIFNFHALLVAYSSSSYLEKFTSPEVIGMLYSISASLAVLGFLFTASILRRFGNVKLTIWLAIMEVIALILIGLAFDPATTIVSFVIFMTINPLLYLNLDIFSETLIGLNEQATGSARGLTLALMSIAAALAPFSLALIVGNDDTRLNLVYFVSAAIFISFIILFF